jgi:hypothetical protein
MDDRGWEDRTESAGVWAFVRGAFSEAWLYSAYGGGAVILALWGYLAGSVPPTWVLLAVIAFGFLVGGFRTWQKERIDRNDLVASVIKLEREIDELSRPRFIPEITGVFVDGDHPRSDWIKLYVYLVIRNQGAESAIDRWVLRVVPPQPATPFVQTDKGLLSDSRQGHDYELRGNLLHDREIIKRGSGKEGWLLCRGPKKDLGLTTGQRPAVMVSFKDVHDNEYSIIDPPNFNADFFKLPL